MKAFTETLQDTLGSLAQNIDDVAVSITLHNLFCIPHMGITTCGQINHCSLIMNTVLFNNNGQLADYNLNVVALSVICITITGWTN